MSNREIRLWGVRTHNLASIDIAIPLHQLVVVTGVSGSGKSSLAFDTLAAEGERRYIETFSPYSRQFLPKLERPPVDRFENIPLALSIGQRFDRGKRAGNLASASGVLEDLQAAYGRFSTLHCPKCDIEVSSWNPETVAAELLQHADAKPITIAFPLTAMDEPPPTLNDLRAEGFLRIHTGSSIIRTDEASELPSDARVIVDRMTPREEERRRLVESLEAAWGRGKGQVDVEQGGAWRSYHAQPRCPECGATFSPPEARFFRWTHTAFMCPACGGSGEAKTESRKGASTRAIVAAATCPACDGDRFSPAIKAYRLAGIDLPSLLRLSVAQVQRLFANEASHHESRAERLVWDRIRRKLNALASVGLNYLELNRSLSSLSLGEARRVGLTTILGSPLAKTLIVLDEPTAGLHPLDVARLIGCFHSLRDSGNTLVVVEHDDQVIEAADRVVDLGPRAGSEGGRIIFQGTPEELQDSQGSITAQFLAKPPPMKRQPRAAKGKLTLKGARAGNLRHFDVAFPLGVLTVVAGLSGAGKSSLVFDCLAPALLHRNSPQTPSRQNWDSLSGPSIGEVVVVDDRSIGRTGRGNPATYLGFFDEVRRLFAETMDARLGGVSASDFSFNKAGGRCETCQGIGSISVDMQFLPDAQVICSDCQGRRFMRRVLEVKYRGRDIFEVLQLTSQEAFGFFRGEPRLQRRLVNLKEVGLDYLPIGQPLSTLSGGEAQRLKLASYIGRSSQQGVLFLFDEPTLGLHPADVERFLPVVDGLINTGHSAIVIEHDIRFLAHADHIIELGPGAGPDGGRVIAEGPPRELAKMDTPTGRLLGTCKHRQQTT